MAPRTLAVSVQLVRLLPGASSLAKSFAPTASQALLSLSGAMVQQVTNHQLDRGLTVQGTAASA